MALDSSIDTVIAGKKRVTASLTAENQFSTTAALGTTQASTGLLGVKLFGWFALNLSGTWTATVTVQRSMNEGVTWQDVTDGLGSATPIAFTTNGIFIGYEPARGALYRFGIKTGNYTSGTVVGALEQ